MEKFDKEMHKIVSVLVHEAQRAGTWALLNDIVDAIFVARLKYKSLESEFAEDSSDVQSNPNH